MLLVVPGDLQTLSEILIKVASWLTTRQFKEGRKETEAKYLDGNGENEKSKKKV